MPTQIQIADLVKAFTSGPALRRQTTRAVDGVSLDIAPGELFFLLGPSGCGKTTLLRMIAGFIDPTSGRIRFQTGDGQSRDVTHMPPNKRNTGMVFQSYALWPHMTVADNVAFGLGVRKVPPDEKKRRVAEALEQVQMAHLADRRPTQLSGGQQQRVALARALVVRPDVLLLDEPLSNLDAKLRNDLRQQIRDICKSAGITTVYVTHDQKEALSMADRIAIMSAGRVQQLGSPRGLYRRPRTRFVAEFLGDTNLIPATVVSREADHVVVETPAGHLLATPPTAPTPLNPGASVTLSIRPEALTLLESDPTAPHLTATLQDTTYLGDTAQHTATLRHNGSATTLRIAELNPLHTPKCGHHVALTAAPADVVILED